jgi:hypothetical protein
MSSDLSAVTCFLVPKNPNGILAGEVSFNGSPPDICYDKNSGIFWTCIQSGDAQTALWAPQSLVVDEVTIPILEVDNTNNNSRCLLNGTKFIVLPDISSLTNYFNIEFLNMTTDAIVLNCAPTNTFSINDNTTYVLAKNNKMSLLGYNDVWYINAFDSGNSSSSNAYWYK